MSGQGHADISGPALEAAEQAHRTLLAAGLTCASAESLTGGLIGAHITAVPGASATYRGGFVTYATDTKAAVLGVPEDLLAAEGAVHPEVAAHMARGARRLAGADLAVAVTGVAGPDPQDGRPVGTVYAAVAGPADLERVEHFRFIEDGPGIRYRTVGERARIRYRTVESALAILAEQARGEAADNTRA